MGGESGVLWLDFCLNCFFDGVAGLFMALQPKVIACGNSIATFAMAVRFITGPAVMAAASLVVGLRGVLLHIAIVQVNVWFFLHVDTILLALLLVLWINVKSALLFSGSSSPRHCPLCLC